MARRVYLAPGVLRVSRPGHDAATTARENLIFDAAMATLGGSSTGMLFFEASPLGGPSNTYQPISRTVPLPPGTGIPIVWLWNARPDLVSTGFSSGAIQIFYDAAGANLQFASRSPHGSEVGYMIYRNRSS